MTPKRRKKWSAADSPRSPPTPKPINEVVADMPPLLDKNHCRANSDSEDYTGQLLVLKPSALTAFAGQRTPCCRGSLRLSRPGR
jgi:hypothetical protein